MSNLERATKYVATVEPAHEGERNQRGFRVAAVLRNDFALADADAWPLLQSWNARNTPPLADGELRAVFQSAGKNAKGAPGAKADARQTPAHSGGGAGPGRAQIVATYPYRDAGCALLFEVVRFDPKDFRVRRPDGKGGYIWKLDGTPRPLYRLPELLAADTATPVFIAEGEKDVDALRALGLIATCNAGGAGKWGTLSDDSALHGRPLVIFPDKDSAGRKHALDVARRLHGKAAEVKLVELPGSGKDAAEYIEAAEVDGHKDEEIRAGLLALADHAPAWTPAATGAAGSEDGKAARCDSTPVLVNLSTVQPVAVSWLWPGRIAIGKLTLLAGDPGLGKSFISLDLAARITCGAGFPDMPEYRSEPAGVVLLSAEDDLSDTVRPRLDAAGAKADRIVALQAVRRYDETGAERAGSFNLADDLQALELAIGQVPNCRLVILDPISAYLGGEVDSHRNSDIRALLSPLADLASRKGVAVLAVTHLRKGEGPSMYRATGSLAFVAAARAVLVVARDKEDISGDRRFLLPVKNNLGADRGGLAYRLSTDSGPIPCVTWEPDPISITADEALEAPRKRLDSDEGDGARKEAADWLRGVLADGPVPAADILRRAKADGICKRTLDYAKAALRVRSHKGHEKGAAWTWGLPDVEDCKGVDT